MSDLKIDIGVSTASFQENLNKLQNSASATSKEFNKLLADGFKLYKDSLAQMKKAPLSIDLAASKAALSTLHTELKQALSAKIKIQSSEALSSLKDNLSKSFIAAGGIYATTGQYIQSAAELEEGLKSVANPLSLNGEQIAALKKEVIDLSKQTPASTSEILSLSAALVEAGANSSNIKELTALSLKAKFAFGLGASEAANLTQRLSQLTTGGRAGLELFLDKAHATAEALHTNTTAVVSVTSKLGAEANALGFNAEQTAALAASLGSLGYGGHAVERTMKRLFESFGKGGGDAFAKMGIKSQDFMRALKTNAGATTEALLRMLSKYDKQTQLSLAKDLVGNNRAAALVQLANAKGRYMQALSGMHDDSAKGKITGEQEDASNSFNGKMALLKNNLKALSTALGDSILPIATKIASVFAKIVGAMASFIDNHQSLARGALVVFSAFSGYKAITFATAALGNFRTLLGSGVIDSLKLLHLNLLSGGAGLSGFSSVISRCTVAFRGFNLALLANPIGLIVGAVVAAISAVGYVIYKNLDLVKAFFKGVGDGFARALRPIAQAFAPIKAALAPAFSAIKKVFSAITGIFSHFGEQTKHSSAQLSAAASLGARVGAVIAFPFKVAAAAIKIVANVITEVINVFGKAFDAASEFAHFLGDKLSAVVSAVKEKFKADFASMLAVFEAIKSALGAVANAIKSAFKTAFGFISDLIKTLFDKVSRLFDKLSTAKNIISKPFNAVKNAASAVGERISNISSRLFKGVKGIFSNDDDEQKPKLAPAAASKKRDLSYSEAFIEALKAPVKSTPALANKSYHDNRQIHINVQSPASAQQIAEHVQAQKYSFEDF